MKTRVLLLTLLVSIAAACAPVTATTTGKPELSRNAEWSKRQTYLFWGLAGEHHIDVSAACGARTPVQLQAHDTFVDRLLGLLTIGIYAPRHAAVWCE